MNRTGKIARGLFIHYAGQIVVVLVGLWTTRFVLESLGLYEFGFWSLGLNLLNYLGLADLGVIAMLNREVGKFRGRHPDDPTFARDYVSRTAKLSAAMVPLLAVVAAAIWFSIPPDWQPLEGPLAVLLTGFVLLSPLRVFGAALAGVQDHAFAGLANYGGWACGTVTTVLLLFTGAGLYSLASGWIVQASITAALSGARLILRHPELFPRFDVRLRGPWLRGMLFDGVWQTLNSAAVLLFSAADVLLLATFLGPEILAAYALTLKLLQLFGNYATMALQLSLPALSEARERLSPAQVAAACRAILLGQLLLSGFVAVIVLGTNGGFLRMWLGRTDADLGAGFIAAAAGALVLRHLNTAATFTLFALGYNRRIVISNLLDGACCVAAMAVLIPWLGPIGAPCGSAAVLLFGTLPWNLRTVSRELEVGIGSLIRPFAVLLRIALPAALACAATLWILPAVSGPVALLGALIGATIALTAVYWASVCGLLRGTILGEKLVGILVKFRGVNSVGSGNRT